MFFLVIEINTEWFGSSSEGMLHPQESMMCSMLARWAHFKEASNLELCDSAAMTKDLHTNKELLSVPFGRFIEEYRKSSQSDSVIVVSWTVFPNHFVPPLIDSLMSSDCLTYLLELILTNL